MTDEHPFRTLFPTDPQASAAPDRLVAVQVQQDCTGCGHIVGPDTGPNTVSTLSRWCLLTNTRFDDQLQPQRHLRQWVCNNRVAVWKLAGLLVMITSSQHASLNECTAQPGLIVACRTVA
jgi:hypothetical protein